MLHFAIIVVNWLLCSMSFTCDLPSLGPFGPSHDRPVHVQNVTEIPKHKFAVLDFVGLVNQFGYTAEEQELTTPDGYKVKIHRVPGSPTNPKAPGKPTVIVQHGVMASSDFWVMFGSNVSVVRFFADEGYDVWITNVRGNAYGRSHVTLSPDKDASFWKFSTHEMAVYDTATMIDYILNLTGQKSTIYIGHSMGSTIINILLSKKPEYNKKLRVVFQLAPVVFMKHKIPPAVEVMVKYIKWLQLFLIPFEEVFNRGGWNAVVSNSCKPDSIFYALCIITTELLNGPHLNQLDNSFLPTLFLYYPAGTSKQTLYHYLQFIQTGRFLEYDFGPERNYELYNQSTPPDYNLTNVVTPVVIMYGINDIIAFKENIRELVDALPNLVACESVEHSNFNHIDFMNAKDVINLVYKRVLQIMKYFPLNNARFDLKHFPKKPFGCWNIDLSLIRRVMRKCLRSKSDY